MIELNGVTRVFGDHVACDNVNLMVEQGELLTLLGPSGCGKSTTLRCISGSLDLDAGRIMIEGRDVTGVPSHRRNIGQVFQSFALFPHLSVAENVAFPLRVRGVKGATAQERVEKALRLVRLEKLGDRMPRQLSGGQQQRVSLARALSYQPNVVLFDEPLSNLDAKLRVEMRYDIAALQQELGFTSVYVTHDQEEALALSDRIAVMSDGVVHQIGTPQEIYREPETAFVASFVGKPNRFTGTFSGLGSGTGVVENSGVKVPVVATPGLDEGQEAVVFVRPEDLDVVAAEDGTQGPSVSATASAVAFLGDMTECVLTLAPEVEWRARLPLTQTVQRGDLIDVHIPEGTFRAFPADTFAVSEGDSS
jgi:ABC-type Fe3+/spermidine/putrescine transport system ATPase subunit